MHTRWKRFEQPRRLRRIHSRSQHRLAVIKQFADDCAKLLDRFAGAINDLGEAAPSSPVEIERGRKCLQRFGVWHIHAFSVVLWSAMRQSP